MYNLQRLFTIDFLHVVIELTHTWKSRDTLAQRAHFGRIDDTRTTGVGKRDTLGSGWSF